MILPEFDQTFALHAAKLLGHVGAFQIKVVRKLLAVERDIELGGIPLEGD